MWCKALAGTLVLLFFVGFLLYLVNNYRRFLP